MNEIFLHTEIMHNGLDENEKLLLSGRLVILFRDKDE